MPKKISKNQNHGYIGESEFASWASKMGWCPSKLSQDHGIDYVCQIRGDCVGDNADAMPGKTLNVSVRSTKENSDVVKIDRSDAELLLSSDSPMVLAIVKRMSLGQASPVAMKFVDKEFLIELDKFLNSKKSTHTVRFSAATSNPDEIQDKVKKHLDQSYHAMIKRLRIELQLKKFIKDPHVEIIDSAYGRFATVHSNEMRLTGFTPHSDDIIDAIKNIDIKLIFTNSSLLSQHTIDIIGQNEDYDYLKPQLTTATFFSQTSGIEQLPQELRTVKDQLQQRLSLWDYEQALNISEEVERSDIICKKSFGPEIHELLYLLARVHVIHSEQQEDKNKYHIEAAKSLLAKIESMSPLPNEELAKDIDALHIAIERVEKGPDSALATLGKRSDPHAIRIRLAIFLNSQDLDAAVALIEDLPPHDRWCDLAVTAYALKGLREKAETIVRWAAVQEDRSRYLQCIVRLADALFTCALARHEPGKNIRPQDLSEEERANIRVVMSTLQPVLDPILSSERLDSELSATAVRVAWQANYLLGNRNDISRLTRLMSTRRPIPLIVAKSAISGYIEPPSELPALLREDHPNDLEANILAVVVQSVCLGHHVEAYSAAKELLSLADSSEEKEQLCMLFQQIWQEIEGDIAADCEQIALSLVSDNPKLKALFNAASSLRNADPESAIKSLDQAKAEDDINWLQMLANAYLQKNQPTEAVAPLLKAAKITLDPSLLGRTADLALQTEKPDIAAWCYERLIEVDPKNVSVRNNLAYIYTSQLPDVKKAMLQFQALKEIDPENPIYALNLAYCLAQLYRPQESLALYTDLCRRDKPDIRAVLNLTELHLSLGDPDSAMASLQNFRNLFWDNPGFLMTFMNVAYATGDEEAAHEAFKALNTLRVNGGIEPEAFKMVPADAGLEILKNQMKDAQKRTEHLHAEMLMGRMPWVWADQVASKAIYWGWRLRTQELAWIGDDRVNRATYCIYATNAFHPLKSKEGQRDLLALVCPPRGTSVVADISALITLHRLDLLDKVADYFGEVRIPEAYLPTVLEDSRKMLHHQRSKKQNAIILKQMIDKGAITTYRGHAESGAIIARVDEYTDNDEHFYRLIDIIQPVYIAGAIDDADYEYIKQVCRKASNVDESNPELSSCQDILVGLSTLETLANFGLLNAVSKYFNVHISEESHSEVRQRIEALEYQEGVRTSHIDLWNKLSGDSRFRFVSHSASEKMQEKGTSPRDFFPFLASFVAIETELPLLVDDRVCQALVLNERSEAATPAFGTDTVISALMAAGKLDTEIAAESTLKLMRWRYRFLLPSAEILVATARQSRHHPPGQALQDIAEYVHDCMRDAGLFGGSEKTDSGESMAVRLYYSWITVISKFLVNIWGDSTFPEASAIKLTDWCVQEFLPSLPAVLSGSMRVKIANLTARMLLSHVLINTCNHSNMEQMANAMVALKNALKLENTEYLRIVTSILDINQKTETEPEEMRNAIRMMQIRMRNVALYQFNKADARNLRMLEDLELFDGIAEPLGNNLDITVLRDRKHPRRMELPAGPIILYFTEGEKPTRVLAEIPLLLLSEMQQIRSAALESLEQMINDASLAVTPKTKGVLERFRNNLISDCPSDWRPAAVAMFDAFNDDVLVALLGVHQCLEGMPVLQDSLNTYVPKILNPSISSLDSIRLLMNGPENPHEKIDVIIGDIVAASKSISDVCSAYLDKLGYLPLAPRYGMSEAIQRWLAENSCTDVWSEVWDWASTSMSPFARYHACCTFVLYPELVPQGSLPNLWNEILDIVGKSDTGGEENIGRGKWDLHRDLARHYAYHLESQLPDGNSAAIASLAWWLADQVSALFPEETTAQFYLENWIRPSLEQSRRIWLVASPPTQRSFFRHITFNVSSPWAMGLLSIMGDQLENLAPEAQAENILTQFHEAVVSVIIANLPWPVQMPEDPTFAQECSLGDTVLKWMKYQPVEQQHALEHLVSTSCTLGSADGLCKALDNLGDSSLADQIAVVMALNSKAYSDPTIADGVWEILSKADWRNKVMTNIDTRVFGSLVEALLTLQVANREKWFSLLPHFFAELCDNTDIDDRRIDLFYSVIYTSLASNTVSAVRRLLRGNQRAKFLGLVKEFRDGIEEMRSEYPPWVAGKLRGMVANLHVV